MGITNLEITLLILLSISELLALIPQIKQNSLFEVSRDILQKAKEYLPKAKELYSKIKDKIKK